MPHCNFYLTTKKVNLHQLNRCHGRSDFILRTYYFALSFFLISHLSSDSWIKRTNNGIFDVYFQDFRSSFSISIKFLLLLVDVDPCLFQLVDVDLPFSTCLFLLVDVDLPFSTCLFLLVNVDPCIFQLIDVNLPFSTPLFLVVDSNFRSTWSFATMKEKYRT